MNGLVKDSLTRFIKIQQSNQFEEYANAHESWVNIILEKLSEQEAQELINLLDTISYNRSS